MYLSGGFRTPLPLVGRRTGLEPVTDGLWRYCEHVNSASVLILHGSPGSGKTTLARAISEQLSASGVTNGVIDVDELNLVFPAPMRDFWLTNLATIWPNYARVADIHVIIPTVVADAERLELLRAAVPAASFVVCELTAPIDMLKARVTEREPTGELRTALRAWVDHHAGRTDLEGIRDVLVSTHNRPVAEAAREVLLAVGWTG
ncbi:MAG: hypothetical protein JWP32_2347 [Schumannella sp.]|nr:hypothetical protein [Schumannella sp.]